MNAVTKTFACISTNLILKSVFYGGEETSHLYYRTNNSKAVCFPIIDNCQSSWQSLS